MVNFAGCPGGNDATKRLRRWALLCVSVSLWWRSLLATPRAPAPSGLAVSGGKRRSSTNPLLQLSATIDRVLAPSLLGSVDHWRNHARGRALALLCHRYVCPRPRRLGARRWVRSRGGEMIVTMNPLQLSTTIDRGLAPTCWGRRTAGETMPEATAGAACVHRYVCLRPRRLGSPVMAAKSGRRNDCDHEPLTTVCGAAVRRRMVVARLPLEGEWWIGRVRSAGDPSAGNGLDGAGHGGASGA